MLDSRTQARYAPDAVVTVRRVTPSD